MFQTSEIEVNLGPQHPSTHGVLRLKVHLDGETVVDSEPIIGYLHRGVEKLAENRRFPQITPYTDRLDYIAAFAENLAYLGAVEKLLNIEVPPRARYMRTVLLEMQRIASHLLWLATHALDIGAMTIFIYCFREREKILDLFEAYCGARLTYNAARIGGMLEEFPEGWAGDCREFLRELPARLEQYETLLTSNRIWLKRTVGVGVIDAEDAVDYALSGPMVRGSGVAWDIRKAMPYEAYGEVDFEIPVGENGDTYDRYLCRMEEMRQARRIVFQCLDAMPDGPIQAKVPRKLKPCPAARSIT